VWKKRLKYKHNKVDFEHCGITVRKKKAANYFCKKKHDCIVGSMQQPSYKKANESK
jgi:hypothetical protein